MLWIQTHTHTHKHTTSQNELFSFSGISAKSIFFLLSIIIFITSYSCTKEVPSSESQYSTKQTEKLIEKLIEFKSTYYGGSSFQKSGKSAIILDSAMYLCEASLNYSFFENTDTMFTYTRFFNRNFELTTFMKNEIRQINEAELSTFYTKVYDMIDSTLNVHSNSKFWMLDIEPPQIFDSETSVAVTYQFLLNDKLDLPIDNCLDYSYLLQNKLIYKCKCPTPVTCYSHSFFMNISFVDYSGNGEMVSDPLNNFFVSPSIYHEDDWDGCDKIDYLPAVTTYFNNYRTIHELHKPYGKMPSSVFINPFAGGPFHPIPVAYHNVRFYYGTPVYHVN